MKIGHALLATLLVMEPVAARAQAAAPEPATLNVSGDGLVQRSPDIAHVSLTIVTDDADATVSAGKNTTILGALQRTLAPLGIAGSAIRTSYFNVDFVPNPPKNLPPQERQPRYGYITTRTLNVDVSPIENAGKVVDAATRAGVTQVDGVSFDLKDRKGAFREALVDALKDARASAAALAAGGGLTLVRLLRVSSAGSAPIRPFAAAGGFTARMAAVSAPTPPPTDIAPNGPIDVSAHVDVTFEIR